MDKRRVLVDSVKKLIDLNIPENEIISNLAEVGIPAQEAKSLISEAKGEKPEKPAAEQAAEEPSTGVEEFIEEAAAEEVKKGAREEEREKEKEEFEGHEPAIFSRAEESVSEAWEKGIISAVDKKYEEIKRMKDEIVKRIDQNVALASDREAKKLIALFEGQKRLFLAKVESELNTKAKQLTETIDAKISELKRLNIAANEKLKELEEKKAMSEELSRSLAQKSQELEKFKRLISTEMNAEKEKIETAFGELFGQYTTKLKEIDGRTNKLLEAEKQVVIGMSAEVERKVEEVVGEKMQQFDQKVNPKIIALGRLEEELKPKELKQRIAEIQQLPEQIKAEAAEELRTMARLKSAEWEIKLNEQHKSFQEMNQQIAEKVLEIETKLEDFNAFKEQFVATVEKNVRTFNIAIKDFNLQWEKSQGAISARVKQIDAKMDELSEFEKNFADEMGVAIDKLVTKKTKEEEETSLKVKRRR